MSLGKNYFIPISWTVELKSYVIKRSYTSYTRMDAQFGISSSQMKQIRIFERRCLRACLGKYRSRESNFQKYIKNKVIYNLENTPRFDNFIIKLIRNYFADASGIKENSLIFPLTYARRWKLHQTNIRNWICPARSSLFLTDKVMFRIKRWFR